MCGTPSCVPAGTAPRCWPWRHSRRRLRSSRHVQPMRAASAAAAASAATATAQAERGVRKTSASCSATTAAAPPMWWRPRLRAALKHRQLQSSAGSRTTAGRPCTAESRTEEFHRPRPSRSVWLVCGAGDNVGLDCWFACHLPNLGTCRCAAVAAGWMLQQTPHRAARPAVAWPATCSQLAGVTEHRARSAGQHWVASPVVQPPANVRVLTADLVAYFAALLSLSWRA